jgi:hypothetical protein
LQDVYIYGENSITLLGTDSKTASDTYLIQLNLQPTPTSVLNDLIEVTSYAEKTQKETNLLMIKAEKLSADSTVKCIKKLKSAAFSVSSSRKVLALLASSKHRVKIFELEVEEEDEDMEENDAESVSEENSANQETMESQNNNMSSANNSKVPASPLINESNKANSLMKTFGKHQSASSTCSLAPSACSSTGATIATSITLDSSSTVLRSKRKKIFDDDEDEDDAVSESQTFNDTNSNFSNMREDHGEVNSSEMNPSNL